MPPVRGDKEHPADGYWSRTQPLGKTRAETKKIAAQLKALEIGDTSSENNRPNKIVEKIREITDPDSSPTPAINAAASDSSSTTDSDDDEFDRKKSWWKKPKKINRLRSDINVSGAEEPVESHVAVITEQQDRNSNFLSVPVDLRESEAFEFRRCLLGSRRINRINSSTDAIVSEDAEEAESLAQEEPQTGGIIENNRSPALQTSYSTQETSHKVSMASESSPSDDFTTDMSQASDANDSSRRDSYNLYDGFTPDHKSI